MGLMGTKDVLEVTKEFDSQESIETLLEISILSSKHAYANSEVIVSVVIGIIPSTTHLLGGLCFGT